MRRPAAVAAALAAAALAGCGGDGDDAPGTVGWEKEPVLIAPDRLPEDRVLIARVRNGTDKPVVLRSVDIKVVASGDRTVKASGRFVSGFVHGNIPVDIQPGPEQPEPSQRRLGYEARIEPGQSVPLTVAWRQKGKPRAEAVVLGDGTRLELPERRPEGL